ncbi:bifunctional 2-C-methyl-D-erythritol 4-phosphate cytidylyltransferase/2-C-methyl-D-erythritol 2,4-cyclodiphosphate synthase [Nitratifractor sp.]
MRETSLILLAAGSSSRFGLPVRKQWLDQGGRPLWLRVAESFAKAAEFAEILVVGGANELEYMRLHAPQFHYITGGASRQESLSNALKEVRSEYLLVSDIARCCLDRELLERVLSHRGEAACVVPAIRTVDTVYYGEEPVDREAIRLIQTPQLSRVEALKRAFELGEFTDESSAIHALGESVLFVEGSAKAHKLTTPADLKRLECLEPPSSETFTGYGLDTHAFEEGKRMVLGGVKIDAPMGFRAHSDGDVAIHALIDALLGAAGMGDIGEHFPDRDPRWKGADSAKLLETVVARILGCGFEILHADLSILAETPRLSPYKAAIRRRLAGLLGLPLRRLNVKATTSEKMGFVGRKEGVTVHAVATLRPYDWRKHL